MIFGTPYNAPIRWKLIRGILAIYAVVRLFDALFIDWQIDPAINRWIPGPGLMFVGFLITPIVVFRQILWTIGAGILTIDETNMISSRTILIRANDADDIRVVRGMDSHDNEYFGVMITCKAGCRHRFDVGPLSGAQSMHRQLTAALLP
jgi:hypothetical protein